MKEKKAWPTKDVMEQIYEQHLWGGAEAEFYSGSGSHSADIVDPYIEALTSFLTSFDPLLSVCDLGCGDFNVGKHLIQYTRQYIAVDIVQDLIDRNAKAFELEQLEFRCLDIATEDLPSADCAILRQVLQHLSNDEVQSIVPKLKDYNYLIVTEHLPTGPFTPNKDILSGQGTRLKKQSGVDLLESPFQLKVKEAKRLVTTELGAHEGIIETTLYRLK